MRSALLLLLVTLSFNAFLFAEENNNETENKIVLNAGILLDRVKQQEAIVLLTTLSKPELDSNFQGYMSTLKDSVEEDPSLKEWMNTAKNLSENGKNAEALAHILPLWSYDRHDALDEQLWQEYRQGCTKTETLPANIKWKTSSDPTFADPRAVKGGTFKSFITAFPLTLRQVGPNSNTAFRGYLDINEMPLIDLHPVTAEPIPSLATHWSIGKDGKSVYFKLDPDARWSDGNPVTADDFIYTFYFHRSPHISSGWFNSYYNANIDKIVKYDKHTISIHLPQHKPNLLFACGFIPKPSNFYGRLKPDFTEEYDWKVAPNTGPYFLSKVDHGEQIVFTRKKSWWAKDKKYFKYRYNPDKSVLYLLPNLPTAFEHFVQGKIDTFGLGNKLFSNSKKLAKKVKKGLIHKVSFHKNHPTPALLLSLNKKCTLLQDRNIRLGLAHSINVEKIIKERLEKGYERSNTIGEGYGPFTNEDVTARKYNLKRAAEFFKLAGFTSTGDDAILIKGNQRLSFNLYVTPPYGPQADLLKSEALKVGVELIKFLDDSNSMFQAMMKKEHDIAFHGWSVGSKQFGPQYWGQYGSTSAWPGSNNFTNTANEGLDKLITAYGKATIQSERQRVSREIQQWIHDDCAAIPLYHCPFTVSSFWRGLKFPDGYAKKESYSIFDNGLYWIDAKMRKETQKALTEGKTFPKVDITIRP